MTVEEWRQVPNHPDYDVSNLGRVRSWMQVKCVFRSEPYVMSPGLSEGYPAVGLGGRNGRTFTVHSLVAAAFLGPKPAGRQVAHNDGNRRNPRVENLRYTTQADNDADKHAHGTMPIGEQVYGAKLTRADVLAIRRDPRTNVAIAADYPVMPNAIGQIKLRHRWGWLR